jgi:hypothetical protein
LGALAGLAPVNPSRIWVQVGTGKAPDALAFDWKRMAKAAPEALRGRKPWLTAWGQNTRLLVGPFDSQSSAQTFLNRLKSADITGFVWTSEAGQSVDSLPTA